jgi:hypothetical protein
MKIKTTILIILLLNFSVNLAESSHFPDIKPTNSWIQLAGKLTINKHDPVNGADEIAVFVDDGNGGELMVGKTIVGNTVNNYYVINIFQDEQQTQEKDGAIIGDLLIIKVWSSQYNIEQTISNNQLTVEAGTGLIQPDFPPVYQTSMLQYGYLNIAFSNLSGKFVKRSIPTNTKFGVLCFMTFLIFLTIITMRKSDSC